MYIYHKKLANTFHKHERLCSKKQIDELFESGSGISAYPVKLVHLLYASEKVRVRAMFVVPKKKFKRANERNTLRRRMKEAYRLEKGELYKAVGNTGLNLAFIYYGSKAEDYKVISKSLAKLLNNLTREITGAVKR